MELADALDQGARGGNGPKRAILVVDNEPLIQRLLPRMLESAFTVTVAESVDDALEALQSQAFFAVLVDFELGHPHLKGDWLLGEAARLAPATRRLLMSGHALEPADLDPAAGLRGILRKPFLRAGLLSLLEAA